jgi:predicted dehydrogenase
MGMVGGGQGAFIGGVHRMAAALDQQIDLVAGAFSRDPANTKETGQQLYLDPDRCYSSYAEMAEKEAALPADKRIDFVSIVTPNNVHFPVAKTFLEAGFHVVCDKPMTFTLDEAKELVSIVEKSGKVFCLTHNYTGSPMVRHARHLVESGEIGTIRKVLVEYLQEFLSVPHEKLGMKQAVWRTDPAQSGIAGTMGDVGTHCMNLVEYITCDPVNELCADKSTFMPDRKLDEDVNALLRFKGGGKGVLTISQVAPGEENNLKIRVYGSKGGFEWEQEDPNYLWAFKIGEPKKKLTRSSGYICEEGARVTRIPGGHPEGYLEAFATIYGDFTEAVRAYIDGKPMKTEDYRFPTVQDGLRGMEFIYKTIESCDKGSTWVKL